MDSRMVREVGAAAGGVVQFLNKVVDVPVVVPPVRLQGILPGRVLQRFVEQIIDKDGLTVLKTVELCRCRSSSTVWTSL